MYERYIFLGIANVKELSDIYKVTRATIRMSIAGLSWKHVK